MFRVALFEPEIPYNTGNISRLCVGTECELVIVGEPAFSLEHRQLRRAGLDHWDDLALSRRDDLGSLLEEGGRLAVFSTRGTRFHWDHEFREGDTLLFGSETRGLAPEYLAEQSACVFALPLPGPARSLNLSNAVAAVVYEGLRQLAARGHRFPPPRAGDGERAYFDLKPARPKRGDD